MSGEIKDSTPYSYHTFIYPFVYDTDNDTDKKIEDPFNEFCNKIDKKIGIWDDDNIIGPDGCMRQPGSEDRERWDYQTFMYYNDAARNALMTDGKISKSYRMLNDDAQNERDKHSGKYKIVCKPDGITEKELILDIDNIRLKVFNTGIALIIFELEYRPKSDTDNEEKLSDVKLINEYGRRMYLEYLPNYTDNSKGKILAAESIVVSLAGEKEYSFNIRESANKHYNEISAQIRAVPELIPRLLEGKDNKNFPDEYDSVLPIIEPAIDDRMFVFCCILDEEYVKVARDCMSGPDKYGYENSIKIAKDLYALLNIDAGDSTCQNIHDVNSYLKEQLYSRWLDWGTIHAVTNHSMICITSQKVMPEVVNPFLMLYVIMCELVLVQRATLIRMDAKITNSIPEKDNGKWEDLTDIETDFSKFQGEIMLNEVTSQIQGIELYEKIQKMLFVEKLETNIQRQLGNLYQIAEAKQEEKEQKKQKQTENLLNSLTVLAIFSALVDLSDYLGKFGELKEIYFALIAFVVVLMVVFLAIKYGNHILDFIESIKDKDNKERKDDKK